MTFKTTHVGLATVLSAIALGCAASETEPGGATPGGGTGGSGTSPTNPTAACATQPAPGRTPLRRLTDTEYNNTVLDLLNDATLPANKGFPVAEESLGYLNNADAYQTTELHVEAYLKAAETMATAFRGRGGLALPCAADADNCAKQFIADFGKRAFRRPLSEAEVADYHRRFVAGSTGGTFEEGLEWVVGRMLQSANFIYRIELDGEGTVPGQVVPLSDYSIATRLSYFLWQTMPDAELFAAADAKQLSTKDGVAAQTARMLAHPKFDATISTFHTQWLHLDRVYGVPKVAPTTPVWDAQMSADMITESVLFMKSIFDAKGSLRDMLTASHSFVSPKLAQFYGLQHPTGDGFARIENVPHRFGLLTSPAILAGQAHPNQSAPVRRGELIRKQLLCFEPPPPPMNLKIVVPEVTPGTTTRERFEQHRADPTCKGCHVYLDPLGVPLENYDELGRWRDLDGGKPIDTRGELTLVDSLAGNADPNAALVSGPAELGQKLAGLPEVQDCLVLNWFRYSMGHGEEMADTCTINSLLSRFQGSQQNLHDLMIGIATSDGFRYRVDLAK